MAPESKSIGVRLPVTFAEFLKHPLLAILYTSLLVIGYLYIDIKMTYNKRDKERIETIAGLNQKIGNLYGEVGFLNDRLRRADSSIASLTATLKILKEVGKIP